MARKRMFDLEIINQDSFFDLPIGAKALYFLLGMEADDEGFISPKKVLRLYGGTDDDLKILALKNYIIPFKTGVIVITDWKRNNYLDKNRIKETIYQDEKSQIVYNERTEKYELIPDVKPMLNQCSTNVKQMLNQYSIEEYSIEENIREKNIIKKENEEKVVTMLPKCNTEIEIEKDIEKDIKKNNNKKKNEVYFENEEVNNLFLEFLDIRKKIKAVNSDLAIKKLINKLDKYEDDIKIKMLENSIVNSWKDVYELKEKKETALEKLQREIREAEEEERKQ